MRYHILMSLGLMGMLNSTLVLSADDATKMDAKNCSVCHGRAGAASSALFPQLAGQHSPYFITQMKAFRDKSRSDENAKIFMWGISSRLSDENIQKLADFYEAQPPLHLGKIYDQAKYDIGKYIYINGYPDKGVPSCLSCHGEKGEGKDLTPRIGGQHEAYLKRQMKVFYSNDRPAATIMHAVVKGLSEPDVEAIAQFLQAQ